QVPSDRILDDPAVLVFQQPKTLFVRLNGFADRDTVAQAAQNAVPLTLAAAPTAPVDTWAQGANAACSRMREQLVGLGTLPQTPAAYLAALDKVFAIADTAIAELHKVPTTARNRARVASMLAAYDEL